MSRRSGTSLLMLREALRGHARDFQLVVVAIPFVNDELEWACCPKKCFLPKGGGILEGDSNNLLVCVDGQSTQDRRYPFRNRA
jgi:hypothetical protein